MKKRILAAIFLFIVGVVGLASAQFSVQPFNTSTCNAAAICCQVPLATFTTIQPGGVATTATISATLFKMHVTNTTAAAVYAQLFNSVATPAASATPVGASSWNVPTISNIDVSLGDSPFGMVFNKEVTVCCSTTQGTFTAAAAGACGFLLQYR